MTDDEIRPKLTALEEIGDLSVNIHSIIEQHPELSERLILIELYFIRNELRNIQGFILFKRSNEEVKQ